MERFIELLRKVDTARSVYCKMAEDVERRNQGNKNVSSSALKNFLAGGVGGIALVIAGHPLDTIKVRNICNFYIKAWC